MVSKSILCLSSLFRYVWSLSTYFSLEKIFFSLLILILFRIQASCWPISISNECSRLWNVLFFVGCRFVRQWWWVMFRTLWGAAVLRARGSWVRGVVSFWKRTLVSWMKVYCSFTSLNLALRTCKHLEKKQLLVFWSPRCSSGRGPLNDLFQTGLPLTT